MNTWILQRNYTKPELIAVLDEYQIPYLFVDPVPFSEGIFRTCLPEIPQPCILHGTNSLIKASLQRGWTPGAFFSEQNKFSVWKEHLAPFLINGDGEVVLLKDIAPYEGKRFIRPNSDYKEFTGRLFAYEEMTQFIESTGLGDLEVGVSSPKNLDVEWRVFVVDGKAVAASMYAPRGDAWVPPDIYEFALKIHAIWHPAPAYVIDICDHEGQLKVIEYNCITGSGYYHANVRDLVLALTYV